MERKYNTSNVNMLTGAKVIVKHFNEHKTEIIALRTIWKDPYAKNLEKRIDKAISNYLGLDIKQTQRLATQSVHEIQEKALKNLSLFKVNIEADYMADKQRLNFLLTNLGFNSHYIKARKGNQESLIQLLQQIKLNMTPTLKTEITAKGTSKTIIDELIAAADPLKEADVNQETEKVSTKDITAEAQAEFNSIYDEIMAICKIASKIFQDNTLKKEKFTFSRIISNLSGTGKTTTETNQEEE